MHMPFWFILMLEYPILTLLLGAGVIVGVTFGLYKLIKKMLED